MVIASSITVSASEENLLKRIKDLEKRVTKLESLLNTMSESKEKTSGETSNDNSFTLSAGIYIVGEDIEEGKYSISIIDGYGNLQVFSDYEKYVSTDGASHRAIQHYEVASTDLKNRYSSLATNVSEVGNIILKNNMCLVLDGFSGMCTKNQIIRYRYTISVS